MDFGLSIAIIGLIITALSFAYAIQATRQSKREKELVFKHFPPASIADVINSDSNYSISIIYQRVGGNPEPVTSVFVQYLRIANIGRVPVEGTDSASNDKLRIEIVGGRVLDIAVSDVTRSVSGVKIGPWRKQPSVLQPF